MVKMTNRYIIIGWIGGNSELFQDYNITNGIKTAKELKKSTAWQPVFHGSLVDLIAKLEEKLAISAAQKHCQKELDYIGLSITPNPNDPIYINRSARKEFAREILQIIKDIKVK